MSNQLQSAAMVLSLLNYFTTDKPRWGVRELARHIGKSPSIVQRGLTILEQQKLLQQDSNREYLLGFRCVELGDIANSTRQFSQLIEQSVAPVMQATGESVFIYRRHGDQAVCSIILKNSNFIRFTATLGETLQLHLAPFTQIILAFMHDEFIHTYLQKNQLQDNSQLIADLKTWQHQGYAWSKEAWLAGTQGLSVPLFDSKKQVTGSLCIASPGLDNELVQYQLLMKQTAKKLRLLFNS